MSRRPERNGRPARLARARRLILEPLEGRELLSMITVTTAADDGNNSNPTPGSLRAAIITANGTLGGSSISFDIAASGVQTIALEAPLPTITQTVVIDGSTEPGFAPNNTPLIVLDGSGAGAGANGLTISTGGGGSFIRGLSIVGFTPTASAAGGEGILLSGTSTAGGNQIIDDYIGVEADGVTAKANGSGILVYSPNNTIGGTTQLGPNVISGNQNAGVFLYGASATGNVVLGNEIGTNAAGTAAVGNQYGVIVAAPNNTIGGSTSGSGNVLSGNVGASANTGAGILIEGQAPGNVVAGNFIGTNRAGTSAIIPGGFTTPLNFSNVYGIYLGTPGGTGSDNVVQETIGGTVAGAGNLVSGNVDGITGTLASSVIEGNTIGLNAAGTAPISNGEGIYLNASTTTVGGTTALARNIISGTSTVVGASSVGAITDGAGLTLGGDSDVVEGNFIGTGSNGLAATGTGNVNGMTLDITNSTIGGTTSGAGNLVAGNSGQGIFLEGAGGDTLYGNTIGLAFNGTADGNGGTGILIQAAPSTTGTPVMLDYTIGGTAIGQGNVVAHSGGFGVDVSVASYTGVAIRGNVIFANAGLGIVTTTTTPQTPLPSTLFINGDSVANGKVTVTGVYFDAPGTTVAIDLFANAASPTGYGQGPIFLGSVSTTTGASGFGVFSASFTSPATPYTSFSATYTGPSGNTSEFTANFPTVAGASVADLRLTASASSPTVVVGSTITFVETIANYGPSTANGVVFYDTLPINLVNVTVTSSTGTATVGTTAVSASLGSLPPDTYATVTITGTASSAGTVTDQPGASSTTYDPNYVNNFATQTVAVTPAGTGPSADLAIAQATSTTTPAVGGALTYTITVANGGPSAATSVTVFDTLPVGVTLTGLTTIAGATASLVGNLVTINLGTLASSTLATITIIVTPTEAGSLTNLATISGAQYDPNKTNNSSISTLTAAPNVNFYLVQTTSPATGAVGKFQTFTITAANFGPSVATNVTLIDNLPSNATYYFSTPTQGGAPYIVGTQLRVDFGTLAVGGTATLTLILIPNATGLLTNVTGVYTPDVPTAAPAFATTSVSIVAGPSVSAIHGVGNNAQIALTFNEALNATTATNPANFQLVAMGKNGTGPAKTIGIASILYNPATFTVMILPTQAIDPTQYYKIIVIGSTASGVADTLGRRLASTAYGPAGNNFAALVFAGTLPQL